MKLLLPSTTILIYHCKVDGDTPLNFGKALTSVSTIVYWLPDLYSREAFASFGEMDVCK